MTQPETIGCSSEAGTIPNNGCEQRTVKEEICLRTYALAAIGALTDDGRSPAAQGAEVEFLRRHLHLLTTEGHAWSDALPSYLRQPAAADTPLFELTREIGLSIAELLTIALAAAVEDDLMTGRAIAYLQTPVGGSRPTLGLVASAFNDIAGSGPAVIEAIVNGSALASGLLIIGNEGAPLPERSVSVPVPICLALRERDAAWSGAQIGTDEGCDVPLPASIVDECHRHALTLQLGLDRVLAIRSGSRSEGKAVAAQIAQAMGRRPVIVEGALPAGAGPWLILRKLVPVLLVDPGPGERKVLAAMPGYRGPTLAICGPDGSVAGANGPAFDWILPVPNRTERRQLWESALNDTELAAELAVHHRYGCGRIAQLGRLSRQRSQLYGRDRQTLEDIVASSWNGEEGGLGSSAEPLREPIPDEALVVPALLKKDLEALLLRCRARDGLHDGLGTSAKARYHPGVKALLVGPSGTGKTLAAGWLATRLRLPLYRVDLASVTSKYIGETEKNLANLLARAEHCEVVLLFDEADSMFGKRTDVKEANDRFANAQTNYLLQRIESYDGIVLLTSNSRSRFDAAFARRLDLIIDFPLPGPDDRRSLWLSHLGTGHSLTVKEINQIAATVDLNGGQVRNAVLMAATLANSRRGPIELDDVLSGLASEYRKHGRQLPAGLR